MTEDQLKELLRDNLTVTTDTLRQPYGGGLYFVTKVWWGEEELSKTETYVSTSDFEKDTYPY